MYEDTLKIELLQLSALLVHSAPRLFSESRKDVIKFAWNHIKVEDVTCKLAAYVLLSRFIVEYDTPSKIVLQIFVYLLKAVQPDCRVLVKQAIDILIPVLPKRILVSSSSESKLSTWVRWTRKLIIEDGQIPGQLVTIFQLILRHVDTYYDCKDHFISLIISSLARLGISVNASIETRILSVDLGELILSWERRRVEEGGITEEEDRNIWIDSNNVNLREMMMGYFIRFISSPIEPSVRSLVGSRVFELMKSLLAIWPEVNIKLSHFEKPNTLELNEENLPTICGSIDLLNLILENKSNAWILDNISPIQKCIDTWIHNDNSSVSKSLNPVLAKIYKCIKLSDLSSTEPEKIHEYSSFTKMIESVIIKGLQSMTNIYAVVSLLTAAYEFKSEILEDKVLADGMKVLQKLTREHVLEVNDQNAISQEATVPTLIALLHLLKQRIPFVKDYRRSFHECLLQLISESTDRSLLRALFSIVSEWIKASSETFPTIKEKSNLMVKMMIFESREYEDLFEDYLKLVAEIYKDPQLTRSELTVRLEKSFLHGTKSENPIIRNQFYEIFNNSIERAIFPRLSYIIGVQNWEPLANYFWLRQGVDLLFGCIKGSELLHHLPVTYRISSQSHQEVGSRMDLVPKSDMSIHQIKVSEFVTEMKQINLGSLLDSLKELAAADSEIASNLWVSLFPLCWSIVNVSERNNLSKLLVPLLAKTYHLKQAEMRPNVVSSLLDGICRCTPSISLPPLLIKYTGEKFNAWYISLELLQSSILNPKEKPGISSTREDEKIAECALDALGKIYTTLGEDDYFCGVWRRRCLFSETNIAISYEQCGLWAEAQRFYEFAQIKARSGGIFYLIFKYI
jgi:transformation/transcription domain-associated protein